MANGVSFMSRYRFTTKYCYHCESLKSFYEKLDSGQIDKDKYPGVCIPQVVNHMTTNLLTTFDDPESNRSSDARVAEAIESVRHKFVVVGITSQIETSFKMFGDVFPWMAETLTADVINFNRTRSEDAFHCPIPHANKSPMNNYCGPNGTHMPIPDKPDEKTRALIEAHNLEDIAVYTEALRQFERQKLVLGYK